MKSILIFCVTGIIRQALLRESLRVPDIEKVTVIGRTSVGQSHSKLHEIVHADLFTIKKLRIS